MNLRRVHKRNAVVRGIAQNQGQFRPGEDDRVNVAPGFHAIDDREQASFRFGQKFSGHELVHVFVVDVVLVGRVRANEFDVFAPKRLGVKFTVHRELGAEESEAT